MRVLIPLNVNQEKIVYVIHLSQRITNLIPCSTAMLSQCVTRALMGSHSLKQMKHQ